MALGRRDRRCHLRERRISVLARYLDGHHGAQVDGSNLRSSKQVDSLLGANPDQRRKLVRTLGGIFTKHCWAYNYTKACPCPRLPILNPFEVATPTAQKERR